MMKVCRGVVPAKACSKLQQRHGDVRHSSGLQLQVWQRATKHAHGSRQSLHATLHSAQSQDTFWDTREEPCASEATVSLGQLPSCQRTRATRLKHASAPHKSQTTEQKVPFTTQSMQPHLDADINFHDAGL